MYRSILFLVVLLGSVAPVWPAWTAELEDQFIIGDVHTRVGQDFYRKFCMVWNSMQEIPVEGIPVRDIVITEESGARATSKLRVLVGGSVAYVGMLSQRGADVREEVDRAVALSFRKMVQNVTSAENNTPDLFGPGIGSGI